MRCIGWFWLVAVAWQVGCVQPSEAVPAQDVAPDTPLAGPVSNAPADAPATTPGTLPAPSSTVADAGGGRSPGLPQGGAFDGIGVGDGASGGADDAGDVGLTGDVGDAGAGDPGPPIELTPHIVVDTATRYQTIDGFGAALPMWVSNADGMLTSDEVKTLVGMGEGELGLSIIRTLIEPDQNEWSFAVDNLRDAATHGSNVQLLASPWSPPAHMKSNGSTTDGGKLLGQYYADYAAHLDGFVQYMDDQGVTIDVVSVQNEPDWHPNYDSCDWSGQELRDFVRDHGATIGARLLVGESLRFDRAYTDPTLQDAAAAANVALVGGHLYSAESTGFFTEYPLAEQLGKGRWMTEWLTHEADGEGAAIWGGDNGAVWNETLDVVLRSVHVAMDVNWNAYIWWWARRFYSLIGDGEADYGTQKGQVLKRGWAFSHYARFVRPGYTRVGVRDDGGFASLNLTAYEGDGRVVVVMLNRSTEEYRDLVIEIPSTVVSAEAFTTSRSQNRAVVAAIAQGRYAMLEAVAPRSVTTVVMGR